MPLFFKVQVRFIALPNFTLPRSRTNNAILASRKKKNAILTEHIDTSMNGQFVEVHIGWRLTILGVAHVHTYRKVKQR
jgi:hypothetical protein